MQLGVDMNVIKLKIEYKVEESNTPMLIHNDMSENGMIRSICIDGIVEFETRQMTIGELVEPLCVDQVYKDKAILKSVMKKYAIEKRFQYRTMRSNAIKIREFNIDHTSPLKDKVYSQKHAISILIGEIVKPNLVDHKRKYTLFDIWTDVKIYLGVDVNYSLTWMAKEKTLISLRSTTFASYNKLPAYLYMMDITYPGSHIQWVIPEYIMYDEVQTPKFKDLQEGQKRNLIKKQHVNWLVSKGSIHVARVELQVTIGVHVESGLKKFNELFRLYWS
ncbi:hypothetical protein H5410_016965, partial [Solanum commersonii]